MCPCGNKVDSVNDGLNREFMAECPTCASNGGDYKKSPAWVESNRDVSQLEKLGAYKSAALEEKWPPKQQPREPRDKERKTSGGSNERKQPSPSATKKPRRKGR